MRITLTPENKETFEEIQRVVYSIAVFTNPQLFPYDPIAQMPEVERQAVLVELKGMLEELFIE